MRVKRYVVDTLPDALNKIRQELGKDAVILNTKQVKVGGILGLFGKKKVEVIAAIDNQSSEADKHQQPAGAVATATLDRPASSPVVSGAVAAQAYRSVSQRPAPAEPSPDQSRPAQTPPIKAEAAAPASAPLSGPISPDEQAIDRFKRAAAQTIQQAAARQPARPSGSAAVGGDLDPRELLEEIKEMKALVARLTDGTATAAGSAARPDPFAPVEQRLIAQGVLPSVAEELKQRALTAGGVPLERLDEDAARSLMGEQLQQLFAQTPASGIAADSRIIQFIGPTGVGKTTTIAKLAAEQVLRRNQKVGFITSDTYRIAAIDQLKTYATILNVPVEVVFSPDEMTGALERLSDRSLIFMDTAGRNYRDATSIAYLDGLISNHGESETYLVLSLVSKYEDIRAIIENFRHVRIDKVLWTKMDETTSYGSIVNVLHEYALPLSYVTNGQNVPDDISILQPEKIVQHLLGEDANG
jgi:flagellar biosynthesis protein FlhF